MIGARVGRQGPDLRRRRDGEQRRRALLEAALRCFDRAGVLGVGIEDIRREAGASPSSVYLQFKDMNALMLALLIEVFTDLFGHMALRLHVLTSARELVCGLVDSHIEWVMNHPSEARFMYQAMTLEVGGLSPEGRRLLQEKKGELLQPVLAAMFPHLESEQIPAWPPELLDVALLGPAHEALRRWLAGAPNLEPEKLRTILPPLACRSIGL